MKQRILALALAAVLTAIIMLTGCSLATDQTLSGETGMQDKLVGVFVTTESLNLFNMDAWLEDNAGKLSGGEYILEEGEARAYEGKLWAELDGDGCWVFPGYEGSVIGQSWKEDHWANFVTGGFCGLDVNHISTNTHDGVEVEGTIYLPSDGEELILSCNPVYMTADGRYYATTGDSFHTSPETGGMTLTVSAEQTWTDGEESSTYSASFATCAEVVDVADRVVLVHMSADHQELRREEYTPDTLPESVGSADGAAYLIVEEYAAGTVRRTLNQPGDDPIQVYTRTEEYYCQIRYAEVNWGE